MTAAGVPGDEEGSLLEALGLDKKAETVYRWLLAHPSMTHTELATQLGESEEAIASAFDRLSGLALVRPDGAGTVRVVRPEVGMERLLARQQAQLAAWQQRIELSRVAAAQLVSECSDLAHGRAHLHPGDEHLVGMYTIYARIAELCGQLTKEFMSFAPCGAQHANDLGEFRSVDQRILERGIRKRSLWLDSIRNDGPTLEYAKWLYSLGGQVRTVPALPVRMVIMDRECAVLLPVSTADAEAGAVVIHCQGMVAGLCALFETFWTTGTVLGAPQPLDDHGLTPQERECLKLLGQGLTDQTVAVRLGVSHRTARRIAADLMEKLGARSRFEAGLKAATRGWLLPDE